MTTSELGLAKLLESLLRSHLGELERRLESLERREHFDRSGPPTGVEALPQQSLLLRAREAASLMTLSERKLWELTNRGEILSVRIGRAVRYDPADLREWIESNKRSGGI